MRRVLRQQVVRDVHDGAFGVAGIYHAVSGALLDSEYVVCVCTTGVNTALCTDFASHPKTTHGGVH